MDKYNKLETIESYIVLAIVVTTALFVGAYFYLGADEFFVYNKDIGKMAFWILVNYLVFIKMSDFNSGEVLNQDDAKVVNSKSGFSAFNLVSLLTVSTALLGGGWYIIVSLWKAVFTKFTLFDGHMWLSVVVTFLVLVVYGLLKANLINKINSATSREPIFGNTIFND